MSEVPIWAAVEHMHGESVGPNGLAQLAQLIETTKNEAIPVTQLLRKPVSEQFRSSDRHPMQ